MGWVLDMGDCGGRTEHRLRYTVDRLFEICGWDAVRGLAVSNLAKCQYIVDYHRRQSGNLRVSVVLSKSAEMEPISDSSPPLSDAGLGYGQPWAVGVV